MHIKTMGLVLAGAFLFGLSSLAGGQRPVPTLSVPGQAQTGKMTLPGKKNPGNPKEPSCAQEAGISKAAMQERRSIMESTRAQVEAVCAESISDQEKREKIREIRRAAAERMDALITPEQLKKLQECQKARSGERMATHGVSHPAGPCTQSGH
jgi:Spy/CpxP family protein refolding chaperone